MQRVDEACVVLGVQPDRGLVEDVEHAHQPGADLRGEADPLGLAARESVPAVRSSCQVVEADVHIRTSQSPLTSRPAMISADRPAGVRRAPGPSRKSSRAPPGEVARPRPQLTAAADRDQPPRLGASRRALALGAALLGQDHHLVAGYSLHSGLRRVALLAVVAIMMALDQRQVALELEPALLAGVVLSLLGARRRDNFESIGSPLVPFRKNAPWPSSVSSSSPGHIEGEVRVAAPGVASRGRPSCSRAVVESSAGFEEGALPSRECGSGRAISRSAARRILSRADARRRFGRRPEGVC